MIIDKEKFYLKARAKKVACDFDGEKQKKKSFSVKEITVPSCRIIMIPSASWENSVTGDHLFPTISVAVVRPFKNQVPGGHMWNLEYENHLTTLVVVVVVSLIGKKIRHFF